MLDFMDKNDASQDSHIDTSTPRYTVLFTRLSKFKGYTVIFASLAYITKMLKSYSVSTGSRSTETQRS